MTQQNQQRRGEKIAITGLSCLFPGAATPEGFWRNLVGGVNSTSQATAQEFGADPALYYDPQRRTHDTTYSLRGGYVRAPIAIPDGLDRAAAWTLYVAQQALMEGGYAARPDVLARCGLILGNLSFPTQESHARVAPIYDAALGRAVGETLGDDNFALWRDEPSATASAPAPAPSPAAAVAEHFGLGGPYFALDAACASSVFAVGLACEYLTSGKADLMLAGAVSAADSLFVNMGFTHFGAYPETGQSRPLDARSGGLISGEGAGLLVLKRYADAVRDGDPIHAVVGGVGLANDGRGKHPLTPNSRGQIMALERAYAGGINPSAVQYVECHASGTPLGDETELQSMDAFFGASRSQPMPLIGSVKANHGHLLTVAGLASMLKVILSMAHDEIPATIGVEHPLTTQHFGAAQIVTKNTAWRQAQKTAGVNAFGFGGVSAHLVLQNVAAAGQPEPMQSVAPSKPTRMAIIGMDAHFGAFDNLETFARSIYDGTPAFTPLPPKRWKGLADDAPMGAYIEQFEIDFLRFKFPPKADDQPTPQHLLLLKVADNAARDSGLSEGDNVAVIVATETELSLHQYRSRLDLTWQMRQSLERAGMALTLDEDEEALTDIVRDAISPPAQVNQYTSYIGNIVSSRVSALWNFSGAAFTLSSAENSVYKALEVAGLLLADETLDAVVIGAVDLAGGVEHIRLQREGQPLNTGAATLSFSRDANGWMVGEGAGAVVLKRADKAAGQRVYATVEAVAIARGTNADTVADVSARALSLAGLLPNDVGYLEASASGFPHEDEAEIIGLNQAYGAAQPAVSDTPTTALGSAKALIGHTGAASGIASLIRAALCLYQRFIPATPNWSTPKLAEHWQRDRFYVAPHSRTWFRPAGKPRYAAVSGLGGDETCAHLILSDADVHVRDSQQDDAYLQGQSVHLFALDGDDQDQLLQRLEQLETALNNDTPLPALARKTFTAFGGSRYALALVARDRDLLLREIQLARKGVPDSFVKGTDWQTPAGSAFSARPLGDQGVAFVYPGAFNSYPDVGRDWLHLFPATYDRIEKLTSDMGGRLADTKLYPRHLAAPTRDQVRAVRARLVEDQNAMMESGTILAALYTDVMRRVFKIEPSKVFGYSQGEGTMLWAMNIWQDSDAASVALRASPLFKTRLFGRKDAIREAWGLPETANDDFWASFVLTISAAQASAAVQHETHVYLTHVNTPNEIVIAGDPDACQRVIERLGCPSVRAPFDVVTHNEIMMSEFAAFHQLYQSPVENTAPHVTFYSAADYEPLQLESDFIARSIARVSCKAIDFTRLINRLYRDGARIFIELGPGSTCTRWISDTLRADGREHVAVAINHMRLDDHTALVKLIARLVSHRVPMNFSSLFRAEATPRREREVLRTITLGGERVDDVIASDTNRRRFGTAARRIEKSVSKSVPALAYAHTEGAIVAQAPHDQLLQTRRVELRAIGSTLKAQFSNPATLIANAPSRKALVSAPRSVWPRYTPRPAIFDTADIDQFARGSIKACFGPEYAVYDHRRAPRIPNTDLMLVSRFVEVNATRLVTKTGSSMVAEYDVPADMWFYRDNAYPFTPYSMLMEMALQPCGFLSAFMGPTLASPEIDFYFRNLDGEGKLLREVDLRGRTLVNRVVLTTSTILQGIIIQKYTFEMQLDDAPFYVGSSTFGYFTLPALSSQAGLDMGKPPAKWHEANQAALVTVEGNRAPIYANGSAKPFLRLPTEQLAFLDEAQIDVRGGKHGLGYIYATTRVQPSDWYLACHFYQDPVMPGSLGLEAIVQAVQAYAVQANLGDTFTSPRFGNVTGDVTWKYRGQVLGDSDAVHTEIHITRVEKVDGQVNIVADASLWKGALRIYEFKNVGVSICEAHDPAS